MFCLYLVWVLDWYTLEFGGISFLLMNNIDGKVSSKSSICKKKLNQDKLLHYIYYAWEVLIGTFPVAALHDEIMSSCTYYVYFGLWAEPLFSGLCFTNYSRFLSDKENNREVKLRLSCARTRFVGITLFCTPRNVSHCNKYFITRKRTFTCL